MDSAVILRKLAVAKPLQGLAVLAIIAGTFAQSTLMPVPAVAAMPPLDKFLHHLSRSFCVAAGLFWAMQSAVVMGCPPQYVMGSMAGYAVFFGVIVMLGSSKLLEKIDGLNHPDGEGDMVAMDMDADVGADGYQLLQPYTPENSNPPSEIRGQEGRGAGSTLESDLLKASGVQRTAF
jgi:hypothetical protein